MLPWQQGTAEDTQLEAGTRTRIQEDAGVGVGDPVVFLAALVSIDDSAEGRIWLAGPSGTEQNYLLCFFLGVFANQQKKGISEEE